MNRFVCCFLLLVGMSFNGYCPVVISTMTTTDPSDTFPVTTTRYQKGGWITWPTSFSQITDTTAAGIPAEKREAGMVASIVTLTATNYYVLKPDLVTWSSIGIGVPAVPASSTDKALVRWSGTGGNAIQNSTVIIDDLGNISGVNVLSATNASFGSFVVTNNFTAGGLLIAGSGPTTLTDSTGKIVSTAIKPTAPVVISSASIDWSLGTTLTKTLSGNTTFTFTGASDGQTIKVKVLNTVGNFTVTWPTVSWPGGTPPTQTIGAKADIYTFVDFGGTFYGSVIQNF